MEVGERERCKERHFLFAPLAPINISETFHFPISTQEDIEKLIHNKECTYILRHTTDLCHSS